MTPNCITVSVVCNQVTTDNTPVNMSIRRVMHNVQVGALTLFKLSCHGWTHVFVLEDLQMEEQYLFP